MPDELKEAIIPDEKFNRVMGDEYKNEEVYVTYHGLRRYRSQITNYRLRITDYQKKKMKTHKDLDVWKEAMTLVKGIYKLTADFPKEETKSV